MNIKTALLAVTICLVLPGLSANAQDGGDMAALKPLVDSTWQVEANVFAPKTFAQAQKKYEEAQQAIDRGKKADQVAKYVGDAREFLENSLKAAEVAKLTLAEYLAPRNRARQAKAPEFVPALYQTAEAQFMKATEKVESGNVKDGLQEADKSVVLFDGAELEAIRIDVIGGADKLIAKAEQDEAAKYALATLDKARTFRRRADSVLTYDRYNRDEAVLTANRAQYEARHASNIAQTVRSLNRNDQAWEKLMLVYEIEMNRIGKTFGWETLPFDKGSIAAADTVIVSIEQLQQEKTELEQTQDELTTKLSAMVGMLGGTATAGSPEMLAGQLEEEISRTLAEKQSLTQTVATSKQEFSQLSEEHQQVAAELEVRQAREAKLKKAKVILNPSEGEVLFNSANDIVLRLYGLSFDVGKATIKDDHMPLLQKVQEVVEMFPESRLVVEGHTDASGDAATNRQLSEKRAYAVMQYLRQTMLIPAERVSAIGFGNEKPVASNETAEGRAKNRRIDIIIMN
jgi:outer membrane protein OmpA-like peptidoglycan-associated protein